MDDLLKDFLTETSENIATLDVELVRLEKNPNDPDLIGSIFRLVHTIKGTCGFLGLPRLEHLAHAGENVLGKFRDRELEVNSHAVDLILASIDRIKFLLNYLENNEKECPDGDDEELINSLNVMANGGETPKAASAPAAVPEKPKEAAAPSAPAATPPSNPNAPDEFGFVPVPAGNIAALEANMTLGKNDPPKMNDAPEISEPAAVAPAAMSSGAVAKSVVDEQATKTPAGGSVADQSIRVNVDQLETLMTTVSELVLTRNQLLQILRGEKDSLFATPLQRLNQVTSELQEGVMKTRMQPIGNAWAKLPRIVRDLAHEMNKKIDLQMLGADTELDRQVLELIKDPLTHMVRNSADHGIEMPADRTRLGKPETGVITLNAYHEGGHIIIDVVDDGKGLPMDKIRKKILERGMASESELAAMTEQQIMQFIFKAGFSTAEKVTSVSGRGVGMDVVRTNIERIGGTIDFKSVAGKGSSFSIKIPLTLAIVSALIVECMGERFAIPQISVIELVKSSPTSEHRVELINQTPVLRLRNRLLPLVSLRKTLKLGEEDIKANGDAFIVVVQVGSSTIGVIVDRVFDTEEIVVKPVAPILRNIEAFSGNTILGDGSVIMILDLNAIVSNAGNISSHDAHGQAAATVQIGHGGSTQSLLLFLAGEGAQKAVPLSLVARLEEIDRKTIEYSEGSPMVQYRGKLMPLIPVVTGVTLPKDGSQAVLVFADKDRHMGLMVDEILDIVEERLQVDLSGRRQGTLGTSIISGKATDVVDAAYYLSQAFQNWFGEEDSTYGEAAVHRVLLVDDSPFFRNLLTPLLTVEGFDVTAVETAAEALKLQEDGVAFDAIVSDIEMPGMNGFDFVSALRGSDGKWSKLPIFAMSSHATPRDLERGRLAGFTDYVAKFNREGLLNALHETLKQGEAHHE
ncbi:MAG: chemotaxis protein CheW [Bdellovibrionales bacterium]|jgi:two-component system chemotaxis sensor kinase CheA